MASQLGMPAQIEQAIGHFIHTHGSITADDLEGLDAFHAGGRMATRDLAELAELSNGMRLLDIGCGMGGPARWLTREYDVRVAGVDRSLEMIRSGAALNRVLGLDQGPLLMAAQAHQLPFAANSFDLVWMQHLLASVETKEELLREFERVLTRAGVVALHEVVAVPGMALDFPLPWARISSESYLVDEGTLLDLFTHSGFELINLVDWTEKAIDWFDGPRPEAWRHLNLKLLLGEEAGRRARNLAEGLKSGKARVLQAVLKHLEQ